MIRVLPILAAVFALAVTAAPASAGSKEPACDHTWVYADAGETYLHLELENVQITSYQ
jgi:hypothetical protein